MKSSLRFRVVSTIFVAGLISGCSPQTAFQRSDSFSQDNHIAGDLPPDQIPGDGDGDIPPDPNPSGTPGPNPSGTPGPNPSGSPTPNPSGTPPAPNPSGTPGPNPSDTPPNPNPSATPSPTATPPGTPPGDDTPGTPPCCDVPPGDDPSDELPPEVRCGHNLKKVLVCHVPPGNPANKHTICISIKGAVNGHDVPMDGSVSPNSGDKLGACAPAAPTSTSSGGKGKK